MPGPFYFAWVEAGSLPWNSSYAREDEDVFSFTLSHGEGDFPSLEVVVQNPRVGLLASSRRQWAWLSYQGPNMAEPVPVFYGRLLGVPQNLEEEFVRLMFVARPSDYEEQKEELAESLRELPYFDPAWLPEEERGNPDLVLEGRTVLWHIDRITHEVTVSDFIVGEDSAPILSTSEGLYDSLEVGFSGQPVSKVVVHAELSWQQRGSGYLDLTQHMLQAWAEITPPEVLNYRGQAFSTSGQIVSFGGEELQKSWPQPDRRIGGGWYVDASSLEVVGMNPLPAFTMPEDLFKFVRDSDPTTDKYSTRVRNLRQALREVMDRTPGYVLQVIHHAPDGGAFVEEIDFIILPVWRMAPVFTVRWEADRARQEFIDFELLADVQPLLADPGDEGVLHLSFGPAQVDEFIEDVRLPSYTKTERGKQSLQHLIARARSALLYRARAVDVSVTASFEAGLGWSCRQNLAIADPRLPGGLAQGKIKAYRLQVDGSSGAAFSTVTIGCTVGRGGEVPAAPGEPAYVEDGYVDGGYQVYSGAVEVHEASDVGFSGIDETEVDDDGVNLFDVNPDDFLLDLGAANGLVTQEAELNVDVAPGILHVVDKVNQVRVDMWVDLRPVTGGPFLTEFKPVLTELVVPKTIDLEVED